MEGKLKFTCRKRKQKYREDATWINTDRMPYYNSAMITLYASGESVLDPGYSRKLSPMVYWAVEYVCEGEYLISRDENRYRLAAGDLLILYPGMHYTQANPGAAPVKKKELMLNNSPLISLLCNQSDLNGREVIRSSDPAAVEAYFDRIREVVISPDENGKQERVLTNMIFALFTEIIAQCGSESVYNSFDDQLKQLNVFQKELTLERMAEHFKVSVRTLNRLFNRHLNCSPCQYRIAVRMKYAMQLLRSNTLSIKNIAEECGYRHTSFFISEFRKYFRKTPLDYRKELGIFDDTSLRKLAGWYRKRKQKKGST